MSLKQNLPGSQSGLHLQLRENGALISLEIDLPNQLSRFSNLDRRPYVSLDCCRHRPPRAAVTGTILTPRLSHRAQVSTISADILL